MLAEQASLCRARSHRRQLEFLLTEHRRWAKESAVAHSEERACSQSKQAPAEHKDTTLFADAVEEQAPAEHRAVVLHGQQVREMPSRCTFDAWHSP